MTTPGRDARRGAGGHGVRVRAALLVARQPTSATSCGSSPSDGSPFGAAAELFNLSPGAAQHARRALLDAGHLHTDDGRTTLVDPVFADWIRQRFVI